MAIRKIVSRSIGVDVIAAEDLAANSVTVSEILDGAVTLDKIATAAQSALGGGFFQGETSTGGLTLPAGTTAQRPSSPDTAESRFNSTTGSLEFYDGSAWISTNLIPNISSITGEINDEVTSNLVFALTNNTGNVDVVFSEGGTALGHVWVNSTSGDVYVCINITTNGNVWVNIGNGANVSPFAATGGTESTYSSGGINYKVHTFTSSVEHLPLLQLETLMF